MDSRRAHGVLSARSYTDINDRGSSLRLQDVRRELQAVVDALPTQIHPDEREAFLDAILNDISDIPEAPWTQWPDDLYILALTAIRFLARNPVGSQTLLTGPHLSILLFHSALPFPPPASPFASLPPPPDSPAAIEALKVLANLLVLHPAGRSKFARAGGAKAVARALAGRDAQGDLVDEVEGVTPDRLFLLGRLGFLVTLERKEAVEIMVDKEDLVESLVHHLSTLHPNPAKYDAWTELLKLTNNVVRCYPTESASGSSSISSPGADGWSHRFDPLLQPILNLVHLLPQSTLAPPLSTALHGLLSVPFLPRLLPVWHSIPEPTSPASSSGSNKSLRQKISDLSVKAGNGVAAARRSFSMARPAEDNLAGGSTSTSGVGLGLSIARSKSPVPRSKSPAPTSAAAGSATASGGQHRLAQKRRTVVPTTRTDTAALPTRVLRILDLWFDTYVPHPRKIDEVDSKVAVDEALPPVLLLLARAAEESAEIRGVLRHQLLPTNLLLVVPQMNRVIVAQITSGSDSPISDRSPAAGPLEDRKGCLGNLLRLMQSARHFSSRDSAGELLWAVCGSDASTLTAEIGYGNAAGLLFHKGITAPPPGQIQEIPDDSSPSPSPPSTGTTTNEAPSHGAQPQPKTRHPISALSESLPRSDDSGMTDAEKEREAERLFVLFDRLEHNPVISMKPDDAASGQDGEERGKGKGVKEMMRDKLNRGELDEWERKEEEDERQRAEAQDREDEQQAQKEMEAYRKRMGRQT